MDTDPVSGDVAKFVEQALKIQLAEPKNELSEETLREIAVNAGLSVEDWDRVCTTLEEHLQKGRNFLKFGNFEDAAEELDQAAALAPYRAGVLADCGKAHLGLWKKTKRKDSHDRAEECFLKCLELDPGHADAAESLSDLKAHKESSGLSRHKTLWLSSVGAGIAAACILIAWIAFSKPSSDLDAIDVESELLTNEVDGEEMSRPQRVEDFLRDYDVLRSDPSPEFTNSLEMPFVRVPVFEGGEQISSILFAVNETRIKDYREFAAENLENEWRGDEPRYSDEHPATFVNWHDAKDFCEWLTLRERASGTIGPNDRYRLPTDHEWSCAIGIGQVESAKTPPKYKHNNLRAVYPWGLDWPPATVLGNYQGPERDDVKFVAPFLPDAFEMAAPVGSYPLTHWGIHDLGGNVSEWCEDQWDVDMHDEKTVRGGGFNVHNGNHILSAGRRWIMSHERRDFLGFRVVLDREIRELE